MRARRLSKTLAAAVSACLVPFLSACGNGLNVAESTGPTVTIGIPANLPYLSLEEAGKYSGFDVDVAEYVADKLGYSYKQIVWKQVPESQRVQDLNDGAVDMIVGNYPITSKAKGEVDFAGPYLVQGQGLLVGKKDDSIKSVRDLAGKSVCVAKGSVAGEVLQNAYGSKISLHALDSIPQCITELLDGSAQAVSAGRVVLYALNKFKGDGYLKAVGDPFASEYMGIAVKRDSPGLVYQINKDLKSMMESGTWERDFKSTIGKSGYEVTPYNMPKKLSAQPSQEFMDEELGKGQ